MRRREECQARSPRRLRRPTIILMLSLALNVTTLFGGVSYLSTTGLQASAAAGVLPTAGTNALGEPYFGGILGATVFAQPGESVTAYLTNSQAQFTDELWLVSPRVVYIGTNKDVARTSSLQVDLTKPLALGVFPAGADLVFAIHPNVGTSPFQPGFAQPAGFRWGPSFGPPGWFGTSRDWFFSGAWSNLNSDGAPHERTQFFTGAPMTTIAGQSAAYLGFEDSRCCGPYSAATQWVADPMSGADFNDAGLVITRVSAATCRPKESRYGGSEDLLTAGSRLNARRVSDREIEVGDDLGHTERVRCDAPRPLPPPTPGDAMCLPAENPAGKRIPTAGSNPKGGENPDGFYRLSSGGRGLTVAVQDSAGTFRTPWWPSGTTIKLTQAPGGTPTWAVGTGAVDYKVHLRGDAQLWVSDGTNSRYTGVTCEVEPRPKAKGDKLSSSAGDRSTSGPSDRSPVTGGDRDRAAGGSPSTDGDDRPKTGPAGGSPSAGGDDRAKGGPADDAHPKGGDSDRPAGGSPSIVGDDRSKRGRADDAKAKGGDRDRSPGGSPGPGGDHSEDLPSSDD